MTEEEWLSSEDTDQLLGWCHDRMSTRKLLIFASACFRALSHRFQDSQSLGILEVLEDFADSGRSSVEFYTAVFLAYEAWGDCVNSRSRLTRSGQATTHAAGVLAGGVMSGNLSDVDRRDVINSITYVRQGTNGSRAYQSFLLREVVGNLVRPTKLTPKCLTVTVVGLAEAIYADRAFDRLPILADALEEAGCDNADILSHCRGDGPHVRGCWVVDLVLGKS